MLDFELGGEQDELLESLELLCRLEYVSFATGKVVAEPFLDGTLVGLATCKLPDEGFLDGTLIEVLAISKLADETFFGSLIR